MWIQVEHDGLKKWSPKDMDVWIELTDNGTAQVDRETGQALIDKYDVVTEI